MTETIVIGEYLLTIKDGEIDMENTYKYEGGLKSGPKMLIHWRRGLKDDEVERVFNIESKEITYNGTNDFFITQ